MLEGYGRYRTHIRDRRNWRRGAAAKHKARQWTERSRQRRKERRWASKESRLEGEAACVMGCSLVVSKMEHSSPVVVGLGGGEGTMQASVWQQISARSPLPDFYIDRELPMGATV